MDQDILAQLRTSIKASNSDAFLLYQNGTLIVEWFSQPEYRSELFDLASSTKSVVSLLMGVLIQQEYLPDIEQKVYQYYPEWRQGRKSEITIRHLMNHTSGIQNNLSTSREIGLAPDCVKLALAAELSHPPGTVFHYNNKAVNLLSGIVTEITGETLADICARCLFAPLGIEEFSWDSDAAGNYYAMSGLHLTAKDLAKIGQLILNSGVWDNHQLIPQDYIQTMLSQSQPLDPTCGLLWWRKSGTERYHLLSSTIAGLRNRDVSESFLQQLSPHIDRSFDSESERNQFLEDILGSNWRRRVAAELAHLGSVHLLDMEYGEFETYFTSGYRGQYLVVIPTRQLVAVRLIDIEKPDIPNNAFKDFVDTIMRL